MDKIHFIRQLYYEQGKTIPEIIAETGHDRKTIIKYLDMTDFNTPEPKVQDLEALCPKLDPYKPVINEWLNFTLDDSMSLVAIVQNTESGNINEK